MSNPEAKYVEEEEGSQLVSVEEGENFDPPPEFEDPDISNIEREEKEDTPAEDLPATPAEEASNTA
eukprot:14979765-Ditylum_brightwellii.AAC.1